LGIGFDLIDKDIAVRGNFCTVDASGLITDRRAGRISTEKCAELCELLNQVKLDGVELFVRPVREHRFLLVLRGNGLTAEIADTDPQKTGVIPYAAVAAKPEAEHTADIANRFVEKAKGILAKQHPANMLLMRGFSKLPQIPSMSEMYKLKPAAIARYPMYKGLAKLVGMKIYDADDGIEEKLRILTACYGDHDFFYVHVKEGDSAGEDGDFQRKVKVIERVDAALPQLLDTKPDVIVVTGDHSTPAMLKGHSWHPVPVLLYGQWCRPDKVQEFSESACISGGLGRIRATDIMPLAMANALKLIKFGA
jgi:2,3-bisphosphoglycerate-independent phosphoglycerate mutase